MNTMEITRKELYERVWKTPISTLVKELNVSNHVLLKKCKEHNIPVPKNGYWQRLKYNKEEKPMPLLNNGEQIVSIPLKQEKIVTPKTKVKRIVHSRTYEDSITSLKNRLKVQDDYFSKDKYVRDSFFNLDVSEALVKRALNFLNTLIKEIKQRGYEIKIKNDKTIVVINDINLEVSLREKCKQIKIEDRYWDRTVLKRNGKLCFRYHKISSTKEWVDNLVGLIEVRIPEIVDSLVVLAKKEVIYQEEIRLWHLEYEKKKQLEYEIQQKKEREYKDFMNLFTLSTRLHKTNIIRDYIHKYREYAIKNNSLDKEKEEWIRWATRKADWMDPFIEDDDELLKGIDRNSI